MKKQNILFWILVVGALVFGGSQLINMLTYSTAGLSQSMFICNAIVVGINLFLAIKANRVKSSVNTIQAVWIYRIGTVIYTAFVITMFVKAENSWVELDTITVCLVIILSAALYISVLCRGINFSDPIIQGFVSMIIKVVPQVLLAYKIYETGGQGLSLIAIIAFHFITFLRIYKVLETKGEMKSEKNRTGLLISEIGNEISWILVTIAWIGV